MQINQKAYRRGFGNSPVTLASDPINEGGGPGLYNELGTEGARTYFGGGGRGAPNVTEFPRAGKPSEVNSGNLHTAPKVAGQFRGEAQVMQTPTVSQAHRAMDAAAKMEKASDYAGAYKVYTAIQQEPWVRNNPGLRAAFRDSANRVKARAGLANMGAK